MLKLKLWKEGVVGVGGRVASEKVGDARLEARCIGKKIPAPGTEVEK